MHLNRRLSGKKTQYYKMFVAVYSPRTETPSVALCVYGIYSSYSEARHAVHNMIDEDTCVQAFIIDETMKWLPVRPLTHDSAEEEEEMASHENDDEAHGRMGSVCEIRGPSSSSSHALEVTQKTTSCSSNGAQSRRVGDQKGKTRDCKNQREQLDRLLEPLTHPKGWVPETREEYDHIRNRFATLRAFERKLKSLYVDSLRRANVVKEHIETLDGAHPTHQLEYKANYERALRESGIKPESTGLMAFLQ